jgi:hypothetical protein
MLASGLFVEIKTMGNENFEINDEFWLPPKFIYWPSLGLMKELINIGCQTKSTYDLIF